MNCLDDASDAFAKELSEITTTIIDTVKRLEEKHLGEIAKLTKQSKSKLEESVHSVEHRVNYLQYWKERLFKNMSNETNLNTNTVLSFMKMKQIYENIRKLDYSKLKISIQTEIFDSVQKLTSLSCLAKTTSFEHQSPIDFDLRKLELKCADVINISEFTSPCSALYDGEYLSCDKLLLTDHKNRRCVMCDTEGEVLQEISLPGTPCGMCVRGENEVLVTLSDAHKVVVLDSNSLEIKQSLSVDCSCYGIATSGNTTVIGTRESIVMFQDLSDKNSCRTLSTEKENIDDVALDKDGNAIVSNYSEAIVKKLDKSGKMLFKYTHKELNKPFGLTVDGHGNIFVNGNDTNNIHIVSNDGKIIRILEGVQNPTCIKFLRGSYRFLVGECGGRVKVFELRES